MVERRRFEAQEQSGQRSWKLHALDVSQHGSPVTAYVGQPIFQDGNVEQAKCVCAVMYRQSLAANRFRNAKQGRLLDEEEWRYHRWHCHVGKPFRIYESCLVGLDDFYDLNRLLTRNETRFIDPVPELGRQLV